MPSSLASNPLAFLRGAGGAVAPSAGPTGPAMGPMAGGGGDDSSGGGPDPSMLGQMGAANALAPQIMAQQQTEYYKRVLDQVVTLLRKFAQMPTIGPHTQIDVSRAVTQLQAAKAKMDKEKPENADPVQSLLAGSLMQPNAMQGAPGAPQGGLPVTGAA